MSAVRRRVWGPAEEAGYWCTQVGFFRFLIEWKGLAVFTEHDAAAAVRALCGVASRRELVPGSEAATRWAMLKAEFDLWSSRDYGA